VLVFKCKWAPSFKTIHKLYNQFNSDGSVLERKRRWPASVRSPENVNAVRVTLQRRSSKTSQFVLKKLPDVMVVILNISYTEHKSLCTGLSVCMSISGIVIEIKISLIDQILEHFMRHLIILYQMG
jgi:hypothetical protein